MHIHNFTMSDLRACVAAFCLYPLFVFVPGYVAAWLVNLFDFRRRTLPFRVALSLPLSIALCPILTWLLGLFFSMAAVWIFYGAAWLGFAILVVNRSRGSAWKGSRLILVAVGVWIALALFSLVDLQLGNRLYYSVIAFDYSIRSAMIHSLATTGFPPRSPFFYPGHPVALRYHYFWLIFGSLVERLSGGTISPRQALIAGTPWCGMALMGLTALYLRLFSARGQSQLLPRITLAIALLGVTGLDILPTVLLWVLKAMRLSNMVLPSMEWWNEQVDGWIYTMLWEPHHLAGLIACLTGFLILWQAPEEPGRRGVWKNGLLAGAAFATAAGASIHVVFVFALFLAVWMAIALWQKWRRDTAAILIAGVVSVLLAAPYLVTLTGPGSSGPPIQWTVRMFLIPEFLMRAVGLTHSWQLAVGDLLLLPLNYFLELGFFFVVGWRRFASWRAKGYAPDRRELAAVPMAAVSVLTCTFLRSSLIGNNDLGWRGFLPAQFVLLLWAADLLAEWPRLPGKRWLASLACLGLAGSLYDVGILRVYGILADHGDVPRLTWMASDNQLGRRTFAVREAFEWIDRATPRTAVLQFNPDIQVEDTAVLLYTNRQFLAADSTCLTTFGGDPHECAPIAASLKELYAAAAQPGSFEQVCHTLPVDILIAKDTDPIWRDRSSWVWSKPIFANEYVRLIACR